MGYLRTDSQGGMRGLEIDEGNCFLNLGASPEKSFERKRRGGKERERQGEKETERGMPKETERQEKQVETEMEKERKTQTHTSDRHRCTEWQRD